jgi:tRNA threonylcarbamoyladenosine biosynthesis protein TsaE
MHSHSLELLSSSEADTRAIGAAIAGLLRPGDVVGLTGDLGAGKTRLVQGAVKALGADDQVVSPTFMLVREYDGDVPVNHVDAYRLSGPAELEDLGYDTVFDSDAVVFVEWADRVDQALPEDWVELRLRTTWDQTSADPSEAGRPDEARRITVEPHGAAWPGRMARLREALHAFTLDRPVAG